MTTQDDETTRRIAEAAHRLMDAAARGVPCVPVRDLIGRDDVDAAYAVQALVVEERLRAGARVVGRKIGLTSEAVQRQLGVDRPDFGVLVDDMNRSADEVIEVMGLLQPKVEAEVAFVLGEDLDDGPLDDVQLRTAVAEVAGALEIVDSRIAGWDITFGDTVADNGSSGLFVLGHRRLTLAEVEPREVVMSMTVDGSPASSGSGAACLGDPLQALRWLAVAARDLGNPLRAGEIVLSGALGPMVPVTPGSLVVARITSLGSVAARFGKVPVEAASGQSNVTEATA